MAKNINFEVQIMQGGRWTIHARFPASQRDQAIEEAKQLDKSNIGGGVRVIRDVYDSETGTSNEFTVYKSSAGGDMPLPQPTKSFANQVKQDDGYDDDDGDSDDYLDEGFIDDPEERARIKKKRKSRDKKRNSSTSITGLIIKLLLITLFSTLLSIACVIGANTLLEGANIFGIKMLGAALENFLILLFFIVFASSAILLSTKAFKGKELKEKSDSRSKRAPPKKTPRPIKTTPAPQPAPTSAKETDAMEDFRSDIAGSASEKSEEDGGIEDLAALTGELAQTLPETTDENGNDQPEAAQHPEPQENGGGLELPDASDPSALSLAEETQKDYMKDFVKAGLEGAGQQAQSMSNFDKFGVSLYVAGATEALSQTRELSEAARTKIMADGVQTMGFKRTHANSFADKYEEYLVQDPTYMQMFQAGRNAMNTYHTDPEHVGKHLQSALTEWNKPKKKETESGPVTVLFTDIAGSTAMTQALGDAGAQQVVRGHNRIVREALSQWSGKEVKHTGDGIMASFAKTSDGLDAAIQMQRECDKFRQQNQDLPLRLKIGINAGEPIAEDNDLFGSTVQMSARIVDKAQADEIFVSEIVRGICAGKTFKFVNRGPYPMKGFENDPTLYEVIWKEDE